MITGLHFTNNCLLTNVFVALVVFAIIIFILINYLIYLLLKLITGRKLIAIPIMLLSYYFLIRKAVTYIIFPGSLCLYRRKLEHDFQQSMGRMILE